MSTETQTDACATLDCQIVGSRDKEGSIMIKRSEVLEAIEELYRQGMLVKALDDYGKPLLRKGQQVYKAIDHATASERDFWSKENHLNQRRAGQTGRTR